MNNKVILNGDFKIIFYNIIENKIAHFDSIVKYNILLLYKVEYNFLQYFMK